jgi:RNA recognition motif-containing protein
MPVRLFVGNLPYDATEADLRGFFEPAGTLSAVIIPVDRETGKKRGFAFVEFGDPAQAAEATRRFNNQPFMGRNITINEARARGEGRPDSGPRPPMRSPGAFRPGFTPRPAPGGGGDFVPDSPESDRSARAERRSRNFGANAKPVRKRKPSFGTRGEMGARKGPIRERVGGRVYGTLEEDDLFDDDQDLELDLESMD